MGPPGSGRSMNPTKTGEGAAGGKAEIHKE